MCNVISEVFLIALAAITGTFLWNHLSNIYNNWVNNKEASLFGAFRKDMSHNYRAWLAFLGILAALFSVVTWRYFLER